MRRQPAILLAEITWRWCFACAGFLLAAVTLLEFLNSIPVSWPEQLALGSAQPLLALAALVHSLRGSAVRLAGSVILAGTALAVLWMAGAALGRLVTLNALLSGRGRESYRPLLGLSFLRAGLFLAAVLAAVGALILAGFARPADDATPSLVLAVVLIACIWLVWALINWLLSLAAVFVVRDGQDALGSIAAAVELIRGRFGEVVLTSLPFVLLHYLALAAAAAAGVLVFDLMMRVSATAGWALAAIAAGYFAYVDFLYITRLTAYVVLAQGGEAGVQPSASPEIAPSGPQEVLGSQPDIPGPLGLKPEIS
jgi:hypothetical protein